MGMNRLCSYLGAVVGLALASDAAALIHDGDFDASYGIFGKALNLFPGNLPVYPGFYIGPVVLPDGKLLVAASRYTTSTNADFGVLRLNASGGIDTTFGVNGSAVYAFNRAGSSKNDVVSGMALQSTGKILVAGTIDGDSSTGMDMAVVRFKSGGTLDTTFGNSGKAIVQFNLGDCGNINIPTACDDQELQISVDASDRILVTGQANTTQSVTTSTDAFALVRLTAGGIRDTTFGNVGRVTMTFVNGDEARSLQARQLADGQHILIIGGANLVAQGTNYDFALAKLDDLGHPDASFGNGGKVTYGFDIGGAMQDFATDFVELPDGKLFVCGVAQVNNPNNFDFACMQFLANGTPDPAFVPAIVPFDLGADYQDLSYVLRRDSQGRFLLAGAAARASNNTDMAVARLLPSGALDPHFGNGGIKTINSHTILTSTDFDNGAYGIAIQPDEKIIIAGTAVYNATGNAEFEVVRLYGDIIFSDDFEVH